MAKRSLPSLEFSEMTMPREMAESKKDNEEAETEVEGHETQVAEDSAVNEDIKNEKEND